MRVGRVVTGVAVLLAAAGPAGARDDSAGQDVEAHRAVVSLQGAPERAAASNDPEPFSMAGAVVPVIAGSMAMTVAEKLNAAFDMAVERVRDNPDCAGLFENLGCDGLDMLSTTLYIPAHPLNEASACQRGVTAFTMVGASQTWVCRRFSALSLDRAATTVIHEALHHGGLTESPADEDAMNAREINTMVARACGF